MRLNRGTLALLLTSVAVIALVLWLSRNEMPAPAPVTPVVDEGTGPLLPGLTAADVVSVALRENASGRFLRLEREGEAWVASGPAEAEERAVDQAAAQLGVEDVLELAINRSFEIEEIEELAAFGLDAPAWTFEIDRGEGPLEVVFVGNENPQGTRYYVMRRQLEVAAGDSVSAPELAQGALVQLVNSSALERVTRLIAAPPWQPLPTATATATATLNPLSEVEIATATAVANASATALGANVMATLTAEASRPAPATPTPVG